MWLKKTETINFLIMFLNSNLLFRNCSLKTAFDYHEIGVQLIIKESIQYMLHL